MNKAHALMLVAIFFPLSFMAHYSWSDTLEKEAPIVQPNRKPIKVDKLTKRKAYLGVSVSKLNLQQIKNLGLPPGIGLQVEHVVPESPAAKAGILDGDVIERLNEQLLVNLEQFVTLIRMHQPGDKLKLQMWREGKARPTIATLEAKVVPARSVIEAPPIIPLIPFIDDLPPIDPNLFLNDDDYREQILQELKEALRNHVPLAPMKDHPWQFNNQSKVMIQTPRYTLTLRTNDQDKNLHVIDRHTKELIFDGPINNKEELEKVPEEIRKIIPQIDIKRNNIQLDIKKKDDNDHDLF